MQALEDKKEADARMKVLITGGAGFIGFHLANELIKQEYEVILIDNFSRGVKDTFLMELEKDPRISLVSADLLSKEELMELDTDFDYIYHFAAIIGVQNVLNNPYNVLKENVELLINMIELAKRQKNLKRFIFASTSEIYAGTLQHYSMQIPTPETTPLTVTPLEHPRTSYMLSKIYGEALLQQSGIKFTVIRPHNFYGPRMGMSHVIPELLKKAYFSASDKEIEVFSVDHKRTFCYIHDAVIMIQMLAESEAAEGDTFNVGNEMPEVTIMEVAQDILDIVDRSLTIKAMPATIGSPVRRCPSMKKTKACIGYTGKITLKEGIQKTFDWYKKHIFDGNEMSAK